MKIFTNVVMHWDELSKSYITDHEEWYDYYGPVALCCGATPEQTQIEQGQQSLFKQMSDQASQVFGASSNVFQQLQSTFAPTVAAGPSQQGFSPTELSNLNSAAITNTGQQYKNAKAAVGNATAAEGGGNNPALQSGVNTGTDLSLASSAAAETSGQLNQINQKNYEVGRQNYDTAVKGLAGAPDVFNPATSAGSSAAGAGSDAATTANNIASQNNSWMQVATGVLGGIAGQAVGGLTKNLGSGRLPNTPSGGPTYSDVGEGSFS